MAQKWQYKIITQKTKGFLKNDEAEDDLSEILSQLGDGGWELINVTPLSVTQGLDVGGSTKAFVFFFKRPAK